MLLCRMTAGGGLSASAEAGSDVRLYSLKLRATAARVAPMAGPLAMRREAEETMAARNAPMMGLMQEARARGE